MLSLFVAVSLAGVLAAAPGVPTLTTGASDPRDPAARAWEQPRGGPSADSRSDVAPVRSKPVEAWRRKFDALVGEPVSWGALVYVVAVEGGRQKLFALDARTGAPVAKPAVIAGVTPTALVVWQGTLAVVAPSGITFYSQRGDLMMARPRSVEGSFPFQPCLVEGLLLANDSRGVLHVVDVSTQRDVATTSGGCGRPAAVVGDAPAELVIATVDVGERPPPDSNSYYPGIWLSVRFRRAKGVGSKSFTVDSMPTEYVGRLENDDASNMAGAFVARVSAGAARSADAWFAYTPQGMATKDGKVLHGIVLPRSAAPLEASVAVHGDFAIGFARDGALVRFGADGRHGFVIPEGTPLPAGARTGPVTIARDVLYLSNWAVEIESGRVLWCDPDLVATTPLYPIDDGRILYGTGRGELVCARDPGAPDEPVASASSPGSAKRARPLAPGDGDGLVLADGSRVTGAVTRTGSGGFRVAPAKGTARELAAGDVALVENGAEVALVGEQYPVFLAFVDALSERHVDALQKLFERWRDIGWLDQCQRVLNEAVEWKLSEERAREWTRTLNGRSRSSAANADMQRARVDSEERDAREKSVAAFVRAADWSHEHGLAFVASALLARAERILAGQKSVTERAMKLIPPGFPGSSEVGASTRWLKLAEALLPVSGELVARGDPLWKRALVPPWSEDAFLVRTRNLCLFSRERDPDVLAACLANGERTIRVLDRLLGPPRVAPAPGSAAARLDVRLHRDRAEYLAEQPEGSRIEWAAGHYSPHDNVSRFYVPRETKSDDPLERNLQHVLVHELTHHYISDRWLRAPAAANASGAVAGAAGDPERPGFWIVEGFARFVEDQVVEMDRRGERFDDDTVKSIDVSSQLAAQDGLVPLERFLDLSQLEFHALPSDQIATVRLRNTVGSVGITGKGVFYEQSGSLVYFLMNGAGDAARQKLADYLRSWYAGGLTKQSWSTLGYGDVGDLEGPFREFLLAIARR